MKVVGASAKMASVILTVMRRCSLQMVHASLAYQVPYSMYGHLTDCVLPFSV